MNQAATTRDGINVFIPMKHMKLHQADMPMVLEAIQKIDIAGQSFIKTTVDFGRTIGQTICVETNQNDHIVFATRVGRGTKTRFVIGRSPAPCSTVTLIIAKTEHGYRLITGYIGLPAEREVDDPSISSSEELMRCIKFWSTHALCFGHVPVKPNQRLTTEPPTEWIAA